MPSNKEWVCERLFVWPRRGIVVPKVEEKKVDEERKELEENKWAEKGTSM